MDTFTALSVPNRRGIVELLATNGRLSATEIGQRFSISAPAISQHLKILLASDLLTVEKRAQRRMYALNPQKIAEVQQWAANTVDLWEQRLDSLEKVLENSIETSSNK